VPDFLQHHPAFLDFNFEIPMTVAGVDVFALCVRITCLLIWFSEAIFAGIGEAD